MADGSYRIAFTDAVLRTGLPPANPLYFAGALAPMRYYYFWYVLCAAVARLAHVPARDAFYASCIWAGFGLLATVALYTRHFFNFPRKARTLALGLLLITGADLIPALSQALLQPTLNGDTEWWSVDPIDAWPDSLLWVPHHVAAVLCCLLAFLFLWLTAGNRAARNTVTRDEEPTNQVAHPVPPQRGGFTFWPTLLTALAFASAFGLSVYVTFGFSLLLAAWLLRVLILRTPERKAWWRNGALAAALSALLLLPFFGELLTGLHTPAALNHLPSNTPKAHLFSLSVRRMIDSELLTGLPVFKHLHEIHPVLLDQTIRLLLLLPGLAMELGLYGAVLVLVLLAKRRKRLPPHPARDAALFFTVVGLFLTMFVSSSVITNNDFGYRAVMLPQFFLTLLAADLLASWRLPHALSPIPPTPAKTALLFSLLALGAAGTLYWACLLRAWLPLVIAHRPAAPDLNYANLPEDTFELREAFDTLDRLSPADAVVAFRPIDPIPDRKGAVMVPNEYYQRTLVMDAGRQMLNAEGKCAVHFGGDPARCLAIQEATTELYAFSPTLDVRSARDFCIRFGVHYLILSAWDPLWTATAGWPVGLPTIARERRFRILDCGPDQKFLPR